MWLENIFGLAIFTAGFMYLKQITTWTLPSFRWGVVLYRYITPFTGNIPKDHMNREIVFINIIFKFLSSNIGLFKAHPPTSFFKNRIRNYFPLFLGEIDLGHKGVAKITLRIPFSIILLSLAIFITLVASIVSGFSEGIIVLIILVAWFIFGFFREKGHLHEGIIMLKESVNNGALV